jgi:hypothetical protein
MVRIQSVHFISGQGSLELELNGFRPSTTTRRVYYLRNLWTQLGDDGANGPYKLVLFVGCVFAF